MYTKKTIISYALPHIIQPPRIVENQIPSVIDNIFSNNICEVITYNVF